MNSIKCRFIYIILLLFFIYYESDYETVIGYNDIKTANGVYFYVQRSSPCNSTGLSIPYDIERLNIGGSMNLASGVFTAPASGRYYFSFASQSYTFNSLSFVHLRVNGVVIGESYTPTNYYNMPLSASVNLKKGDQVGLFSACQVYADFSTNHYTQFSGMLLEEDLTL